MHGLTIIWILACLSNGHSITNLASPASVFSFAITYIHTYVRACVRACVCVCVCVCERERERERGNMRREGIMRGRDYERGL